MREYYGLIGHPLGHSISSKIHQALYRYYGMDCSYLHYDLLPEQLSGQLDQFRRELKGFNITIPYKQKVLPLLDEIQGDAKLFGAVNTVVVDDGRLIGYNTDGLGFMKMLDRHGITVSRRRVVVLGAGGAGGTLAQKIALEGASEVVILNRSIGRAKEVSQRAARWNGCSVTADYLAHADHYLKTCDLLINTTSLGMYPHEDEMPLSQAHQWKKSTAVVDIIYNPKQTKLLKEAKRAGCMTLNGLGMLLYQAFYAFELWTGKMPPDELEQQLEQEFSCLE